jgi:Fic family protein
VASEALQAEVLDYVRRRQHAGEPGVSAGAIQEHTGQPRASVNRALTRLLNDGLLQRQGAGRAVTYRALEARRDVKRPPQPRSAAQRAPSPSLAWSAKSRELLEALSTPLGTRKPVSYRRAFVDRYQPNKSHLLPRALADELLALGKSKDQLPAGTFARKVLEQLLIDLSWYSSRLEGNRKSLLDTRELFERGRSDADDHDATMLLNHKDTIEFMVDAVPTEGITVPVVRNLQSLLMRDLLPDPADLGAIRSKVVHIQDSVYLPAQVPKLLEEMLHHVVEKVRHTRNPVESAFFMWVNIAYLQPFVDGNKRTSRLGANLPLLMANCAPLSFLDVEPGDYALAMLGVYERLDVSLAVELFAWTYRRSIDKYQAVLDAMGGPDPMRVRYREQLGEAVRQVVFFGLTFDKALESVAVPVEDRSVFARMLDSELEHLAPYNCARYRLPIGKTQEWVERGRPR